MKSSKQKRTIWFPLTADGVNIEKGKTYFLRTGMDENYEPIEVIATVVVEEPVEPKCKWAVYLKGHKGRIIDAQLSYNDEISFLYSTLEIARYETIINLSNEIAELKHILESKKKEWTTK